MKTITTSIPYTNAKPHIGFAMEVVQADFFARYYRAHGEEVHFQTGTDEHGRKIERSAQKNNMSAQDYVDSLQQNFQGLLKSVNISHNRFVRTTDADHHAMAQALWRACAANGDIVQRHSQAWYDVVEEEYLGSVEEHPDPAVFGVDAANIERVDEINYVFLQSKYTDRLRDLLENDQIKVWPKHRRNEMLQLLEKGLPDVAVSRERSKLSWGIPVPGDENHVMYVWYDALTNYLTGTSTIDDQGIIVPGNAWSTEVLHCIGKGVSRFHLLLWPAMLLSADISLPKEVLIHGYITVGGTKMSKSLGNVIDPVEAAAERGSDALRWYMLKEIPTFDDCDWLPEHVAAVYASDLVNELGNLATRVWSMAQRYSGGVLSVVPGSGHTMTGEILITELAAFHEKIEQRKIHEGIQALQGMVRYANRRIEDMQPWKLAKDSEQLGEVTAFLHEMILLQGVLWRWLAAALPDSAATVATAFGVELSTMTPEVFMGEELITIQLGTDSPMLFPRDVH
jgi:methionyl-tRNA synthetase